MKKWKLAPTSSRLSVRGFFVRVGPGFGPDCCLFVVLRWPTAPGSPCDMKRLVCGVSQTSCTHNSIAFWFCVYVFMSLNNTFLSYRRSSSALRSFCSSVTCKTFHSLSEQTNLDQSQLYSRMNSIDYGENYGYTDIYIEPKPPRCH